MPETLNTEHLKRAIGARSLTIAGVNVIVGSGKEAMPKRYNGLFETTVNLHYELAERIVKDNTLIDPERIQIKYRVVEAIAIYQIENDKIKKYISLLELDSFLFCFPGRKTSKSYEK